MENKRDRHFTEEEIKEAVKIVKESVSDLRMIMRRR